MTERNRALHSRSVSRSWVLGFLCVGLMCGVSSYAEAAPEGSPTPNSIFFNCTFSTDPNSPNGDLQSVLNIHPAHLGQFEGGRIQASYIIIYVRANPNEGQDLKNLPSFTGPILCTNDVENVVKTTEGTEITGPVDIVGTEEASHLQFRPTGGTIGDTEKRVCHTIANNTECFLIQP